MNLADQIKLFEEKARIERESRFQPVPLISFANLQKEQKPILPAELMDQVLAGIAASKNLDKWRAWGFKTANSVLLFSGLPGTGKTTTAKWVARRLGLPLVPVTGKDIGSGDFGDSERNIERIFKTAAEHHAVIFFDECEALIWDRGKATGDSMWMIAIINAILTNVEAYDGNVILASNHAGMIDGALMDRVTFEVKFTLPDYATRLRLWAIKWPKWPLTLDKKNHEILGMSEISGRKIEQVIKEEARYAIEEDRRPSFKGLIEILKRHT